MANTKLSALTEATALTDADELYVNDGGTSKKITAANARHFFDYPSLTDLDRTNYPSTFYRSLYVIPGGALSTNSLAAGWASCMMQYVPGCTPSSVSIYVTTAGTASTAYVGLYEVDETGLPGAKVASWGTFDTTSTGIVTLTGQSTTIASGFYYVVLTNFGDTVAYAATDYRYGKHSLMTSPNNSNVGDILVTGLSAESTNLLTETKAFNGSQSAVKVWVS